MQRRTAQVGHERRAFESTAANIFERPALRARCSGLVEVYRDAEVAPYPFTGTMSDRHAVGQGRAFERHERHHVRRADPWMHPAMPAEIDALDCHPNPCECCIAHGLRRAGECNHRAIVIRVHLPAQHFHAADGRNSRRNRLDDRCIASFRNIRNAFNQLAGHRTSDRSTRILPLFMTRSTRFTPK